MPEALNTLTLLPSGLVLAVGPAGSEIYEPKSNHWRPTRHTMTTPRYLHVAIGLGDGRVLVIGGTDNGFTPLSSVEIFHPSGETWTKAKPLHAGRWGAGAVLLKDGRVLVAGGTGQADQLAALRTTELWSPVGQTWSAGPSMKQARGAGVALVRRPDATVVATFGDSVGSSESWKPGGTRRQQVMPHARGQWATARLLTDGRILVVGGNGRPDSVEIGSYPH